MIHLRLIVPTAIAPDVLALLQDDDAVINVVRVMGASQKPHGDMLLCDVPDEAASFVVTRLREAGIDDAGGTIAIVPVEAFVSEAARDAEHRAAGELGDAVLWEAVRARAVGGATLSYAYLWFMVLSSALAVMGLLSGQILLVIGAVILGPEYPPIAAVCLALVERRGHLGLSALRVLFVGFALAVAAAAFTTLLLVAADVAPPQKSRRSASSLQRMSSPNPAPMAP